MRLNELRDLPGASKNRKRVGRGIGSGTGKRSGRGNKGQNSRSGVALKGFEGGQMPIHRRLPKRGFSNVFRKRFVEVSLDRVQAAIDAGRLDAKKPIDAEALKAAGLVRRVRDGVRVLGGKLKAKITLNVAGASKPAIAAIEGAGGSITVATGSGKADAATEEAGTAG